MFVDTLFNTITLGWRNPRYWFDLQESTSLTDCKHIYNYTWLGLSDGFNMRSNPRRDARPPFSNYLQEVSIVGCHTILLPPSMRRVVHETVKSARAPGGFLSCEFLLSSNPNGNNRYSSSHVLDERYCLASPVLLALHLVAMCYWQTLVQAAVVARGFVLMCPNNVARTHHFYRY